ncbi:MAG: hypothetical protein M3O36_11740, partial [Myxococcota bacterium]|nr:hypothetical protein [Myxococcota bacterium]
LGHTATAWATYRQAASAANAEGRRDYVATAQRHADALAPRLARLTVNVPERIDGIELKRDGLRVTSAEWGASIPVDPGAHVIVASAPGRKTWTSTVDAADGAAQLTVDVPVLEPAVEDAPRAVEPAPSGTPPSSSPTSSPRTADASGQERHAGGLGIQRTAALVAGGLAAVSLAVGTGLAVSAKRQYDDSLGNCLPANRNVCSGAGVSQRDGARNAGNAATFAFALGAAALVGGGALWLTAPRPFSVGNGTARISLVPTIGGAFVMGSWR